MTYILGIDLGTTNSSAAIWRDGQPEMIPDSAGRTLTPSVVALNPENGQWLVGHEARQLAGNHPETTIYSIKRLMGRRFGEDVVQQELAQAHIFYDVTESRRRRDGLEVAVGDWYLTPQEVSAKILQKIKADAEAYLTHPLTEAVITVPAYFHDSQRQATRDAARIAGLTVKRILNEPTAACLAFGYKKLAEARHTVAVYDLGGGTFDISILEVGRGPFRVRATNGDTHLGGDDLDWLIVAWLLAQIGDEAEQALANNLTAKAQLLAAAEQAKIELTTADTTHINLADLPGTPFNPGPAEIELTRTHLEEIAVDFVGRTLGPCRQAMQDAGLGVANIQEVLLVGGQTRMPAVRQRVSDFFGQALNTSVNPDEVVALGAAVQAAILAGQATGLKLADVVPLSLGVNTKGRMDTLIPRNSPIPIAKKKLYSTADDNQESVDIQVFQGEKPQALDNIRLGSFILRGIEPAPAGDPEIEVTFQVDQDGILLVTGKDLRSGNFKEITITDSIRLSAEEIEAMVADAEAHAAEYAAQHRQVELQEQAERLERHLSEVLMNNAGNVSAELVADIKQILDAPPPYDWSQRVTALKKLSDQTS